MKDDTREELERLEKELLSEEDVPAVTDETVFFSPIKSEDSQEESDPTPLDLDETIVVPAFDDPDIIHDPEEPLVYRNFSNAYGKELEEPVKSGVWASISRDDKISMILMIIASGLCLGIIGVLVYWLIAYL